MNWPHIHSLVNHFPVVLSVVGCAVLIVALFGNKRGMWMYALATLTLAGLSIYPADFTGDQAADVLRKAWYIMPGAIREHDEAADFALISMLIMGAASAYAWWRMLKKETTGLPPKWLRISVVILALWSLSVVVRTAYLGGLIVHGSPKLDNPPPASTR